MITSQHPELLLGLSTLIKLSGQETGNKSVHKAKERSL